MSLTSLARAEVYRGLTPDERRVSNVVNRAIDLAPAYAVAVPDLQKLMAAAAEEVARVKEQEAAAADAFESLVKYIPTESATLYLAAASAGEALEATVPFFTPEFSYWFFAVVTPVIFFLIFLGKRRAQGLTPILPSLGKWPWFKLVASFVAFLAWGLAVPSNPYATSPSRGACFAFAALLVSTVLSLLEGAIEPKPQS